MTDDLPDTTDAELYDAWCEGDPRAANALAKRHLPALFKFFACRVNDRNIVADLVQSTLEKLVKSQHKLADRTRFRAFVFGIAGNVLKNHYGEHRRERLLFPGDEQLELASTTLDELGISPASEGSARAALLVHALHHLPIESQQMLMLHFEERMKYDEIAEMFDIPQGTVASRLNKARKQLQQAMQTLEQADESLSMKQDSLSTWAVEIRTGINQPALGTVIPRRLGKGWRLVRYTCDGDALHGRYRRSMLRPVVELEVRRTPRGRSGVGIDTVSIRNREWIRQRDHRLEEFALRHVAGTRELRLAHRPTTDWDSLVELAGKLDLDKLLI